MRGASTRRLQQFNPFMIKSFTIFGLAVVLASAGSAHAASTTFLFDGGDQGQMSPTKVANGIKLTLSSFSAGPRSGADSDGFAVYCALPPPGYISTCEHSGAFNPYTSYQITFDQDVKLLNYNVSYINETSDSTTTYTQGTSVSVQPNSSTGLKSFANQFIAAANSAILVSTVDTNGEGLLQINALTVEKQTPPPPASVPSPLPLAGAATAFSLSRELRRRMRRAVAV